MIWLWAATITCYHSLNIYLKYMPGDIFVNSSVSSVAEIFGHIAVGGLIVKLGPKGAFTLGYVCVALGAGAMIFQQFFENNAALVSGFVLFAKFGASMALCCCYIATPFLFPVLLAGTAFGICKLVGNVAAISAGAIVELAVPLPMMIITAFSVLSIFVSLFINSNVENGK